MDSESVPMLLVTANVGSVFEDPARLLHIWTAEFLKKIVMLKPQFVALHLQEVGGKTYEKSMEYVQDFIKILCEAEEMQDFERVRIYLDEDYNSPEHFTALGNMYFVSKAVKCVKIWNFLTHEWDSGDGKSINTGNIEAVPSKEKSKFPQHFFPECKWSRKGFLRTRWELNGSVIDMVNIHLFHDASNLAASEEFPSVYCKSRRRALVHTLERFHKDPINEPAPYFVFGDFNFRCDTEGVVKKLTEDLTTHRIQSVKTDHTKVQYRNSDGENVLTVGKKEFTHADHQTKFKESWLQQFDREMEPLKEVLVEFPITFPPSYPYEEDPKMPHSYMSTRCPAWCDRILMSPIAKNAMIDDAFSSSDYNIIGDDVCMGDHKPVYLNVRFNTYQGTIRCNCWRLRHDETPAINLHPSITNNNNNNNCSNPPQPPLASFSPNTTPLPPIYSMCLYDCREFYRILIECDRLDCVDMYAPLGGNRCVAPRRSPRAAAIAAAVAAGAHQQRPKISINLTDDENLNVCVCSVYASADNVHHATVDGGICPQCENIIKQQPTEHRKTLISKRLTIANDIIVNRVDMHHLNLNSLQVHQDPYTPESCESHSPLPDDNKNQLFDRQRSSEEDDGDSSQTTQHVDGAEHRDNVLKTHRNELRQYIKGDDDFSETIELTGDGGRNPKPVRCDVLECNMYGSRKGRGVSPRQLKSRLENLRRTSHRREHGDVYCNKRSSRKHCKRQGCCQQYCEIL